MRTEGLLEQSQRLTAQLQSRQNELQQTNEELASKAKLLAEQNAEVERKNAQVEQARFALEEKAAELALTSKYKSEFLANMSHELRTPLNSIIILSQQLAENPSGTLSGRQVEFCRNINSSGSDLLHLINDILDLSKIESGTVTLEIEEIPFNRLRNNIERTFRHVAEAKNLPFRVKFADGLPHGIESDPKRLQQILKNLLSNALKFTARGHVELRVKVVAEGWSVDHPVLSKAPQVVAFTVEDTGTGIAVEKQKLIFEAFQQADAGTSRKYGGTGLGLAISRELALLLSGEIKLTSVPGQGSIFTLYLPLHYSAVEGAQIQLLDAPATSLTRARNVTVLANVREERIEDDRDNIASGEPSLLIIENDPNYARILLGLAREKGLKGIVASNGATGISLARSYHPTAISLDVLLPDIHGWAVLRQLKLDASTRHIPIQIITVVEERQHGLGRGAFAYYVKEPTTDGLKTVLDRLKDFSAPRTKRLLIVEDSEIERQSILELLDYKDIEIVTVATGGEAIDVLTRSAFDCMVLDLRLPDMTGFALLERLHAEPVLETLPVVVFTGKELTAAEQTQLRSMAKSVVLKDAQSPERLLDETALFLHRVVADLPKEKQAMLERIHGSSEVLRGRKVLVADDDARNIFALASLLENQEMEVITATSGRMAIDLVARTPDLSVVLMDIMMPDMDGYETIRKIREDPRFRTLPILALTAKAMKGDREKCLDAGASDYISKPVDTDQLLSLMRVWLFR
jgi:signal transduction histidine kinase/CheY-like chemotaxis protein